MEGIQMTGRTCHWLNPENDGALKRFMIQQIFVQLQLFCNDRQERARSTSARLDDGDKEEENARDYSRLKRVTIENELEIPVCEHDAHETAILTIALSVYCFINVARVKTFWDIDGISPISFSLSQLPQRSRPLSRSPL
jgi:hypothetical protein